MERAAFLKDAAVDAARAWAETYRLELEAAGRPREGGWPGTLPEARGHAAAHVGKALADRSMAALTYDELGRVARIAYDEARRRWREGAT